MLPRGMFEFVDRGTEDDAAIRGLRQSLDALHFQTRILMNVSRREFATEYFGTSSSMPVIVAPSGAAGLLWYDGEIALARAARHAGVPFTLSTVSITSMERVAEEAGGDLWFQLYMWPERSMSYQLVDRARACGYRVLVVTADTPVMPKREFNQRNGFSLPMRITRQNVLDVARNPGWFFRVFGQYLVRSGVPMLQNYPDELRRSLADSSKGKLSLPRNDSLSWEDFKELRKRWTGPLILKGVLSVEDAEIASRLGADGIIVSNHGGRALDTAVAPMDILPKIAERLNGSTKIIADGGTRRGSDVAKALALGADGVMLGRAPLWGLTVAGENGALHAIELLRDEFDRVMALTGCNSISDLSERLVDGRVPRSPPRGRPVTPLGKTHSSTINQQEQYGT